MFIPYTVVQTTGLSIFRYLYLSAFLCSVMQKENDGPYLNLWSSVHIFTKIAYINLFEFKKKKIMHRERYQNRWPDIFHISNRSCVDRNGRWHFYQHKIWWKCGIYRATASGTSSTKVNDSLQTKYISIFDYTLDLTWISTLFFWYLSHNGSTF